MVSLAHGTNDAQKTMGVITLALIANGTLAKGSNAPNDADIARVRSRLAAGRSPIPDRSA